MIQTRRDFMKLSAASLVALAGGFPRLALAETYDRNAFTAGVAGKGREYIALTATPNEFAAPNDNPGYVTDIGSVVVFDVAAGESFEIPVPFFGHSVSTNPARPYQLAAFERWGKQGALVDIKDRRILAVAEASDANTFFGHSVFTADGKHLLTTEDNSHTPKGALVLRDASTLKIIHKMNSYGLRPHECRTLDEGKTLMVANGGYRHNETNISWIDIRSEKLLNQVKLGTQDNVAYTHCSMSADHWICAVGASDRQNPNFIAFVSPDGRVLRPAIPEEVRKKMVREAVSILFLDKDDLVAVTIPHSSMMLVFNYKKQSLVEVVQVDRPIGLLLTASKNEAEANVLVSLVGGQMLSLAERNGTSATRVVESRKSNYGAHLLRFYV